MGGAAGTDPTDFTTDETRRRERLLDGSIRPNDTVHLSRRLVRRRTLKNHNAAAVRCNGLFAGAAARGLVEPNLRYGFASASRTHPCRSRPIFLSDAATMKEQRRTPSKGNETRLATNRSFLLRTSRLSVPT